MISHQALAGSLSPGLPEWGAGGAGGSAARVVAVACFEPLNPFWPSGEKAGKKLQAPTPSSLPFAAGGWAAFNNLFGL